MRAPPSTSGPLAGCKVVSGESAEIDSGDLPGWHTLRVGCRGAGKSHVSKSACSFLPALRAGPATAVHILGPSALLRAPETALRDGERVLRLHLPLEVECVRTVSLSELGDPWCAPAVSQRSLPGCKDRLRSAEVVFRGPFHLSFSRVGLAKLCLWTRDGICRWEVTARLNPKRL